MPCSWDYDEKKHKPRIYTNEIYEYIAANTSLTKVQVRECFEAYGKMLQEITTSNFVDLGLKIPLPPHIGHFQFNKINGWKKGSTYVNINYLNGRCEQKNFIREKNSTKFYSLRFKISPSLKRKVKESTKFEDETE